MINPSRWISQLPVRTRQADTNIFHCIIFIAVMSNTYAIVPSGNGVIPWGLHCWKTVIFVCLACIRMSSFSFRNFSSSSVLVHEVHVHLGSRSGLWIIWQVRTLHILLSIEIGSGISMRPQQASQSQWYTILGHVLVTWNQRINLHCSGGHQVKIKNKTKNE